MGTSTLYVYEMQDSVWDGFCRSDDSLVPYPINEAGDLYGGQTESCEKPWDGEIGVMTHKNEDSRFPNLTKKDRVMTDQDFKGNVDSATEFCSDGGLLNQSCTAVGNNIYDYQTDNQISFLENGNDGSERSDILHYGWPDIGNFEEIDQMFRSCDSTFGQESLTNEDEMCWFPSSYDNEGSGDAMKSGFHLSSCESSGQKGLSEGHETKKISTMSGSTVCQTNEVEAVFDEKTTLHKKRQRDNKSGGKDEYFENCGYLHPGYSLENFEDVRISGNSSCISYSSSSIEQNKHEGEPLFGYRKEDVVHQDSSFCHHPASKDQFSYSSNQALDSSFTNSAPDETSLEATSFQQLQQAMEKLDVRTKLCIRDGLYRLARSAEKRHGCENLNGSIRDDTEEDDTIAPEETNECTGFMDMETNTNPIDRSIAHLLFHGPNPSIMDGGSDNFLHYPNELGTNV